MITKEKRVEVRPVRDQKPAGRDIEVVGKQLAEWALRKHFAPDGISWPEVSGAGEGNRTLTYSLGSYRSTTELLPLGWNKLENSTRLVARARMAAR